MKIKLIGIIIFLSFLFCGCGVSYNEAIDNTNEQYGNGYFTTIAEWNEGANVYRIVYANDSKVKYFICESGYRFGITELWNTDGSLQIYGEQSDVKDINNDNTYSIINIKINKDDDIISIIANAKDKVNEYIEINSSYPDIISFTDWEGVTKEIPIEEFLSIF